MAKILISEFINKSSLNKLKKFFKVYYDEKLWENPKKIIAGRNYQEIIDRYEKKRRQTKERK